MYRSKSYLDFVRGQVCCAPMCVRTADHAHHFARAQGGGGVAIKPHDTFVAPLCSEHHCEVHQHGGLKQLNRDRGMTDDHFFRTALQLLTEYLERSAA